MATKEECLRIMKEITNKAREEGCLLELPGDRVFTPDDLDARNQHGEFIWANWRNWDLTKPEDYLGQQAQQIKKALHNYEAALAQVTAFMHEQESWKAANQKGQGQG